MSENQYQAPTAFDSVAARNLPPPYFPEVWQHRQRLSSMAGCCRFYFYPHDSRSWGRPIAPSTFFGLFRNGLCRRSRPGVFRCGPSVQSLVPRMERNPPILRVLHRHVHYPLTGREFATPFPTMRWRHGRGWFRAFFLPDRTMKVSAAASKKNIFSRYFKFIEALNGQRCPADHPRTPTHGHDGLESLSWRQPRSATQRHINNTSS